VVVSRVRLPLFQHVAGLRLAGLLHGFLAQGSPDAPAQNLLNVVLVLGNEVLGTVGFNGLLFNAGAAVLGQVDDGQIRPLAQQGAGDRETGLVVAVHVGVEQGQVRSVAGIRQTDVLAGRLGELEDPDLGGAVIKSVASSTGLNLSTQWDWSSTQKMVAMSGYFPVIILSRV